MMTLFSSPQLQYYACALNVFIFVVFEEFSSYIGNSRNTKENNVEFFPRLALVSIREYTSK